MSTAAKRIKKAHKIAKAYEEAGFIFNSSAKLRLKQMAAWAGCTVAEARAFARMVENKNTLDVKPMPLPEPEYPATKRMENAWRATANEQAVVVSLKCEGKPINEQFLLWQAFCDKFTSDGIATKPFADWAIRNTRYLAGIADGKIPNPSKEMETAK